MVGLAPPKTIFISAVSGNDSNDGLTALTPVSSMAAVRAILANGDTIQIMSGQYADSLVDGKTGVTIVVQEPVVDENIGGGLPNVAGRVGRNAGVVMPWNDRPGQFSEPGRKVRG